MGEQSGSYSLVPIKPFFSACMVFFNTHKSCLHCCTNNSFSLMKMSESGANRRILSRLWQSLSELICILIALILHLPKAIIHFVFYFISKHLPETCGEGCDTCITWYLNRSLPTHFWWSCQTIMASSTIFLIRDKKIVRKVEYN